MTHPRIMWNITRYRDGRFSSCYNATSLWRAIRYILSSY